MLEENHAFRRSFDGEDKSGIYTVRALMIRVHLDESERNDAPGSARRVHCRLRTVRYLSISDRVRLKPNRPGELRKNVPGKTGTWARRQVRADFLSIFALFHSTSLKT